METHPARLRRKYRTTRTRVAHVRHARDERRKGADDGNELGVDDGLAAMLLVKRLGALQVFLFEEARIRPVEDRRPARRPSR